MLPILGSIWAFKGVQIGTQSHHLVTSLLLYIYTPFPTLWIPVGHIHISKPCQAGAWSCLPQLSKMLLWHVSPRQDSWFSPSVIASQGLVTIWDIMSISAHPLSNSHLCHPWVQRCRSEIPTAHPVPALRKCTESYIAEHRWNFR